MYKTSNGKLLGVSMEAIHETKEIGKETENLQAKYEDKLFKIQQENNRLAGLLREYQTGQSKTIDKSYNSSRLFRDEIETVQAGGYIGAQGVGKFEDLKSSDRNGADVDYSEADAEAQSSNKLDIEAEKKAKIYQMADELIAQKAEQEEKTNEPVKKDKFKYKLLKDFFPKNQNEEEQSNESKTKKPENQSEATNKDSSKKEYEPVLGQNLSKQSKISHFSHISNTSIEKASIQGSQGRHKPTPFEMHKKAALSSQLSRLPSQASLQLIFNQESLAYNTGNIFKMVRHMTQHLMVAFNAGIAEMCFLDPKVNSLFSEADGQTAQELQEELPDKTPFLVVRTADKLRYRGLCDNEQTVRTNTPQILASEMTKIKIERRPHYKGNSLLVPIEIIFGFDEPKLIGRF